MSILAVGGALSDPVNLVITIATECGSRLLANECLLVGEGSDGDVSVDSAIDRVSVASTHPLVGGKILGTT
jgi:hypothetical protein